MTRSPHQPTLRELLRPVLAHRWLLLGVVAIAIAASVIYSETKKPVYQAQASIAYQDQSYDLGLVGLTPAPSLQTASQLAAAGAETITQPMVAAEVARTLGLRSSPTSILGLVNASVSPASNLVEVTASAPTAAEAQALADAFAQAGAAATNSQVRAAYAAGYQAAAAKSPGSGGPASGLAALDGRDLSRLRLLSSIATAAQVVKPAQLPSTASSPRKGRDAALAAVLGVVLGLLAVYIRDAMDPRVRTVEELKERLDFPVLGHVHAAALGRSPRTGSDRGVTHVDWELSRILRRNLDFLEPRGRPRAVAVTSSVPKEGKSTVAALLAFASASAGQRTALVECDLRGPTMAQRLGLSASPGVTDRVSGEATRDDIVQIIPVGDAVDRGSGNGGNPGAAGRTTMTTVEPATRAAIHEVACITAGTPSTNPVEVLRSEAFEAMLADLRDSYDLVILDTPPLLSVADALELLPQADCVVLCARMFRITRQQLSAGLAALERLPRRPTALVLTGTRGGSQPEYGYYGYYP